MLAEGSFVEDRADVERPDGRLVVSCLAETASGLITTGGTTWVIDEAHDEPLPITANISRQATRLLAILPDGEAVDPWTGHSGREAMSGGDEGCGGGALSWWGLAVLGALARRGKQHRSVRRDLGRVPGALGDHDEVAGM